MVILIKFVIMINGYFYDLKMKIFPRCAELTIKTIFIENT